MVIGFTSHCFIPRQPLSWVPSIYPSHCSWSWTNANGLHEFQKPDLNHQNLSMWSVAIRRHIYMCKVFLPASTVRLPKLYIHPTHPSTTTRSRAGSYQRASAPKGPDRQSPMNGRWPGVYVVWYLSHNLGSHATWFGASLQSILLLMKDCYEIYQARTLARDTRTNDKSGPHTIAVKECTTACQSHMRL